MSRCSRRIFRAYGNLFVCNKLPYAPTSERFSLHADDVKTEKRSKKGMLRLAVLLAIIVWAGLGRPALAAESGAPSRVVAFAPLTAHFTPDSEYFELFREDLESRWPGRVEMRTFLEEFQDPDNIHKIRRTLETLADDPSVAAVVIGEAPVGSLEGIIRLRTKRPDVYVFVLDPHESLEQTGKAASLTVSLNQQARGFLYPTMAARMGADCLVYLSYPRSQDIPVLGRQYRVISAVTHDMNLLLASELNGPDPLVASPSDLESYLTRTVDRYLEIYGENTAFMTTSSIYSEMLAPIIARKGGALLEPLQPSLLLGLPEALDLADESRDLFGYWRRLLTTQDEKYLENPPRGQFASWAYPYPHTAMLAVVDLAVGAVDEQTDIYDLKNVASALEKHSAGAKWQVTFHLDYANDNVTLQVILVLEDTYWFGHGYQGFTRLNIPSRYYRIR